MRKVLSFSGFLMLGLVVSQFLPMMAGDGYGAVKSISNVLLYVCLSFIMINVGREFVLDKTRWKSYAQDYFIAMATAALPWFMIAIYYVFILLPPEFWNSWEDSSSDYDDRAALAVDYCGGDCVLVIVDRLAKIE